MARAHHKTRELTGVADDRAKLLSRYIAGQGSGRSSSLRTIAWVRLIQHRPARLYVPEQRPESFLFKVPVVREDVAQTFPPHRLHRNAIRQAITFIRAAVVERQALREGTPALRYNANVRIA